MNAILWVQLDRKQPNKDTWEKQRQMWIDLILSYAKHHRLFSVDVDEMTAGKSPLFCNEGIKRKM